MDMSNATAAGPSRGLLDILFGSDKPGEAEADGQGFGALMNVLKTLNEIDKDKEARGAELGRTLRETMPLKGEAESLADGMSGFSAVPGAQEARSAEANEDLREKHERLMRLAAVSGIPVVAAPIQEIRPDQVNELLERKALPPLKPEEMKLLRDVNGKIGEANGRPVNLDGLAASEAASPLDRLPPSQERIDPWMLAAPKSVVTANQAMDPRVAAALDKAESVSVAQGPERMVSTESYLQMHQSVGKAVGQASAVAVEGGPKEAVLGPKKKGLEAASGEGVDGGFGTALSQQLKTDAPAQQEVFLPSNKPGEIRTALLGQVGNSVAIQARKGGGEMKLVINPNDLGEVRLKVGTKNGQVEVQVTAENEDVASIIRGGSRELSSALEGQNLTLAKLEVSVSSASSMTASDGRNSLSEQFFSQSNSQQTLDSYMQENGGGRQSRWESGHGQQGSSGGYQRPRSEEREWSEPSAGRPLPRNSHRASPGRLDVVA